jgi:beta-barrel assembly-enhancing protease
MKRRRWIAGACAHCALLASGGVRAQADWAPPPRFARPEIGSDEGGLWAMMDREETRLRRSPFRMREEGLQEYLQALACQLGGEHCPDIRVYPVRTPFFNASMAPNGMMVVWSGLLLRVENEAQLCAVLAHEVGHFLQRHSLARLRDAKSRSAFGSFFLAFGAIGAMATMATLTSAFGFSRDQEREADQIGLALMEKAGYDPREAAKVWANLLAEVNANPAVDKDAPNPMMATHPAAAERARTLADLSAGRGGKLGQAEYQRVLAPLRYALLDDELKRGRHPETLALLGRMLALNPADAELLYFRGEMRRQRAGPGDTDAALADLKAAAAAGNEPAAVHRALGYLYRGLEQPEAARLAFQTYLDKHPAAPDAGLIRHYLSEGKPAS